MCNCKKNSSNQVNRTNVAKGTIQTSGRTDYQMTYVNGKPIISKR